MSVTILTLILRNKLEHAGELENIEIGDPSLPDPYTSHFNGRLVTHLTLCYEFSDQEFYKFMFLELSVDAKENSEKS